ncbi:uncharacterized protein Bfra_012045 [Botrytis fragariae]|uniref:Uncharacterized protein n=1 Tax=Botrytis fragariae TaxID=1964551 RepID=A0A8H6AJW5_9HELO|nr:uncharacterized protein Bfra_012045 [Botrytis fragariae]KAF5868714.1 hypothetical protein Bfra_012045 [Botrytis fragariae]
MPDGCYGNRSSYERFVNFKSDVYGIELVGVLLDSLEEICSIDLKPWKELGKLFIFSSEQYSWRCCGIF